MSEIHTLRILLVGPLPPPIGGATRLFSYLAEDLRGDPACEVEVINISRPVGRNSALWNGITALRTALRLAAAGRSADVISLHANERGRTLFGPVASLISRLLGKPLVVRAFGGAFDRQFEALGSLHRKILCATYFRSQACLFETRNLVQYFEKETGCRAVWFPNCTRRPQREQSLRQPADSCYRLVFLGRVVPEKGVDLLLEAADRLDDGIEIDLYGPIDGDYTEERINERGKGKVVYHGVLDEEGVQNRISDYHALVLPTFHPGEGYPGVILEAYAHGLPVITTRWLSIPEIVDESCGLLIEPHDLEQLVEAVNLLSRDDALYRRLCRGSESKGEEFSDVERTEQFLALCRELAGA